MRRVVTVIGAFFIIISLMACSEKKEDKVIVSEVVQQYYSDIAAGHFDKAQALMSKKNTQAFSQEAFMQKIMNNEMKKRGGFKMIDIISTEFSSSNKEANISAIIFMGNETKDEKILLIKEDNDWKINPK